MNIISPEKWTPCDGVILEDAADKAVRSSSHVLVIAGPGAGKTELLAQKAAYLLQTNQCRDPQKILAISFKKDAAQNLKERVEQRCGAEAGGRFISMTYDAFSKSLLDHFLYALPAALRPQPEYQINDDAVIDAAFRKAGFKNPDGLRGSRLKKYYDDSLSGVTLPIVKSGFAEATWPLLLNGFDHQAPTLTFKMISMLVIYLVKTNPFIQCALHLTYSYVFLDEFQDTTSLQYELIRQCFYDSLSKITAVGDNKQRIMIWAGADKAIFNKFFKELSPDRVRLIMNHRSAPRLVALQRTMYDSLNEQAIQVKTSSKWDPADGDIDLLIADNEELEAQAIAEDIASEIANGTSPNEICILCKQRPMDYASVIISELKTHGISARIETEYQDLIKEPIIDLLLRMILCAFNKKRPHDWEYIQNFLVNLNGIGTNQVYQEYDQMQEALASQMKYLKTELTKGMYHICLSNVLNSLIDFLDADKIKANFPEYRQKNRLEELIAKFKDMFWENLNEASGDWELAVEVFQGLHSVPIMTIHKSKGLEYSSIYFVGLEDSAFWSFRTQPEEDRCAFFVALSRAKRSITFTYCKRRENLKYPQQSHRDINEFFELLQQPGMANIKEAVEQK